MLNYPCRIAVESSGPYSTLLMGNLRKMGLRPFLINPLRIKRFSSLSLRLTKTDPLDARTIALFLASGQNTAPNLIEGKPSSGSEDLRRATLGPLLKVRNFNDMLCTYT